jgi:hypothetical protein
MRFSYLVGLLLALIGLVVSAQSYAGIVIYGTQTDHPIVPGGDLTDVRMDVDLLVSGGVATMTFTNVSIWPELSAVFKEIVVDTYDDDLDTGGAVLWNPVILTATPNVSYSFGDSNGLPGYQAMTNDSMFLLEFQADAPAVQHGIGPGEVFQVQFDTSLADGSDIYDYLAFFDGGEDTANYTIGFHAISADTVDGQSLSGIYEVPEPATIMIGALGLLVALRLRKARAR